MRSIPSGKAALVGLILILGACAGPGSGTPSIGIASRPLIVDVDMDSSDVLALPYVLTLRGYDVKAITVAGTGIGHCPPGADHARAIAAAVGHPDVPVACGAGGPVVNGHRAPAGWRIPADALYGVTLATPAASADGRTAVQLLADVLRSNTEGVDVLATGPLTNIAQLLAAEPTLTGRIRRVVTMAGAIRVPGNVEADPEVGSPEWNAWADPAAMAAVVASGVPIVMVPLDATNDVPITESFFSELAADHAAAGADIVFELLARNRFLALGGQFFWDPLAAAFLEDSAVVTLTPMHLQVGGEDGPQLGRTVEAASGSAVQVATAATADRFQSLLLAGLRRSPIDESPFVPGGPLRIAYDGISCTLSSAPASVGPYWVRIENPKANVGVALVTLHPGATWQQLIDFGAGYVANPTAPDFAAVVTVPTMGPGIDVLLDVPAGTSGFACVQLRDGAPAALALSASFEAAP